MPGPRSFTKALIKELTACVTQAGCVITTDLHRRLVAREANLHATPVYISLVSSSRPVTLTPLSTGLALQKRQNSRGTYYQITFHTEDGTGSNPLDEIADWLGGDRPDRIKAVTVHNVLQMTNQVELAYNALHAGKDSMAADMDGADIANITSLWQQIHATIEKYNSSENSHAHLLSTEKQTSEDGLEMLLKHLTQLDSAFTSALNRGLFNSANTSDLPAVLKVLDSPVADIAVVNDQLQKRRIICDSVNMMLEEDRTSVSDNMDASIVTECKVYGIYIDPADIPEMKHRVGLLAAMLHAQESRQFLALRCRGWHHDSIDKCFRLHFDVPETHIAGNAGSKSLQEIISTAKVLYRPTLNQRLKIAWQLAKAVENWHGVCWVHQGISSASVRFLRSQKSGSIDYEYPILHGFEFARPNGDPSLGRAHDDFALAIYRHPDRQGTARKTHTKIHDIYSLGVVLLEIGLWRTSADILRSHVKSKGQGLTPAEIQKQYITACNERLAHHAGESYCNAVVKCLSSSFNINIDDQTGSRLARAFQESVVDQLCAGVTFANNMGLLSHNT